MKNAIKTLMNLLKAADEDGDNDDIQVDDEEEQMKKKLKKGETEDTKEPDASDLFDDDAKPMKKAGDEYDSEYMRKHLKKCMADNPNEAREYAKELGYLQKATDEIVAAMEDGLEEADSLLLDGTEFIKSQSKFNDAMLKAINSLIAGINTIGKGIAINHEFAKASAEVLVEAHEGGGLLFNQDEKIDPKKSVSTSMQKAKDNDKQPLIKAADMSYVELKRMILKAVNDGNADAMNVAVYLDTCKGNLSMLPPHILKAIDVIADHEVQK